MKICPTCKKTYTDETLNFCLEDGAVLNQVGNDDNSQATVFMGQPPLTIPNQSGVNPTLPTYNPTYNQNLSQRVSPQTPKKSKAWIWVLGIVGAIIVLGGIGFIGIVALVASNIDDKDTNTSTNTSANSTPISFKNVLKDDFSKWKTETNEFATMEYRNGDYIMTTKKEEYFYVYITNNKTFKTSDASTKITLRNVNGIATELGYGLLIHSDPDKALVKDYGFLIDSAKQSYRIVQHTALKETSLVAWTRFPSIRSGTQTNEIEVRDQSGKMSLYINGQFVTSVNDSTNFSDGVYGIYASGLTPIAFSNLQIGK